MAAEAAHAVADVLACLGVVGYRRVGLGSGQCEAVLVGLDVLVVLHAG